MLIEEYKDIILTRLGSPLLDIEVESENKSDAINKSLVWCIKEAYPIKEIKADDVLTTIGIIKLWIKQSIY